jgi:hypothetical protein
MLLSFDYYQAITGDTDTPVEAFATAASAAQDLLEDALGLPGFLESKVRTEELVVHDGVVYPTATPVTVAEGYTVVDDTLYGATPDLSSWVGGIDALTTRPTTASITYTGGWTGETAPGYMRRDLAFVTWSILRPAYVLSVGAIAGSPTSASVGDVSVSYGSSGAAPDGLAVLGVDWSYFTMRHRPVEP